MVDHVYWTAQDEDTLVNMLFDAAVLNHYVHGANNKPILVDIAARLSALTGKNYTYMRVLFKVNSLYMRHRLWQSISSTTGVSWNAATLTLHARDEVWDAIIQRTPAASIYRYEAERHRHSLTFIFAGDLGDNLPQMHDDLPAQEVIVISDDEADPIIDVAVVDEQANVDAVVEEQANVVVGQPIVSGLGQENAPANHIEVVVIEDSIEASDQVQPCTPKVKAGRSFQEGSLSSTGSSPMPRLFH
ncbi:hypothetical protein ACJIZ3_014641 [Penstemon smallii]|uniref:Myb/SANT-like domain-containing protein n=1 Tax=Penstemon smallii TaxID=265156 RepID=A0ABD3RKH0_9LAMI